MSRLPRVYLAGKISKHDWRHSLFPLRHVELTYDREHDRVVSRERLNHDGFEYAGPYFLGDDHGCFHGPGQHGIIDPGWADGHSMSDRDFPQVLSRRTVSQSCLAWIADADVVFCWLEGVDAYGTLVELGYAHARGIPIYVATDGEVLKAHDLEIARHNATARAHDVLPISEVGADPWLELWFAREISLHFDREWSIADAWEGFTRWWAGLGGFNPDRRRLWVVEAR